jgi:hypothetical protein
MNVALRFALQKGTCQAGSKALMQGKRQEAFGMY